MGGQCERIDSNGNYRELPHQDLPALGPTGSRVFTGTRTYWHRVLAVLGIIGNCKHKDLLPPGYTGTGIYQDLMVPGLTDTGNYWDLLAPGPTGTYRDREPEQPAVAHRHRDLPPLRITSSGLHRRRGLSSPGLTGEAYRRRGLPVQGITDTGLYWHRDLLAIGVFWHPELPAPGVTDTGACRYWQGVLHRAARPTSAMGTEGIAEGRGPRTGSRGWA